MSRDYYIFQPFSHEADASAHFLARCLSAAQTEGFTERFTRISGGYKAARLFYAYEVTTHVKTYALDDSTKGQKIMFTRLLCGTVKGFVIDYDPLKENSKTHQYEQ